MSDETVPPPPPGLEDAPSWASDSAAAQEEKYWSNEDKLKGQKTKNDLIWLKAYGIVLVGLTVFFAFLFILSLGFWAWHYLMPERWGWMSETQLSKVQSIIFSGSLGAIVSTIVGRQMAKN